MLGHLKVKGVGAKMRNLAKEVYGSLRVATFKFTVCRTHAAKRLKPASGADCLTGAGRLTNFLQAAIPTLFESTFAKVGTILVRENADGHLALRIDSTAVLTTAAGIFFGALGAKSACQFVFRHFLEFGFANGIAKIEGNDLFSREANLQGRLRAIGARIDKGIELEFDAKILLGKALHFLDFMKIDSGGNGLQFEREIAVAEKPDTLYATIERSWYLRQSFVGTPRGTVHGDLNGEGTEFSEVIGNARSDHGAVGEDGD